MNSNSIVGKSTGIALLLAAGLLAALFAMGVFSAQGVLAAFEDDPAPTVELSDDYFGTKDVTMTVTFQIDAAPTKDVTITPMHGTTALSGLDATASATIGDDTLVGVAVAAGTGVVTIDFNADDADAGDIALDAAGAVGQDIVITISGLTNPTDPATMFNARIVEGAYDGTNNLGVTVGAALANDKLSLSSTKAGAAVQVVVYAWADDEKTSSTDISITLGKFGVPTSITERSIIIEDNSVNATDVEYIGEPGSIVVDGSKVTLALFARFPGASTAAGTLTGAYRITFKQSAGITNPATAGTATVTVNDGDTESHSLSQTIRSVVTLSEGSGARGTDETVTGVGLGAGGATVFLVQGTCADQHPDCTEADDNVGANDDISLGTGTVSDGKVEIDIETSSSDFLAGVDQIDEDGVQIETARPFVSTDYLRGKNQITIVDGTGRTADTSAYFTITPTIDVDEEAIQQGDELTIIVEDWYYGIVISVTIGDERARITDYSGTIGDFEIDILVPPSARLGEQQLKVTGTTTGNEGSLEAANDDVAKGTVIVGALSIDVEPSTFVLGQQFTINVKGFSTDDPVTDSSGNVLDDIQLVKIGNHDLEETTGGVEIDELSIDTNGFFTNTFRLHSDDHYLRPGDYRVQVEDHSGRVALGRITIPEPTITIDPAVSRRGTTVNVTGNDFPAGRVVQLYYRDDADENQQGAVLADSAGRISISFTVPSDAEIGEEQDVTAISATNVNDYKAKASHSLPPQEIIVAPAQVAPGGRLTIEGHNMPLYTLVRLTIADISVAGRGAETDGLGSFVKEDVLVPQLKPGTHTVEASVETQGADAATVRTTIEIVESFTTGTPAEVFEPLGDRLVRVWYLDRATQVWSFYDPDPDVAVFNTLTDVSSGQNISIIVNAGGTIEFQGETLYAGTNPIALD